jgi:hypothetical protein
MEFPRHHMLQRNLREDKRPDYQLCLPSNQCLMRHFSYTKLRCLADIPKRFGARRRHPHGVLS